MITVDEAKKTVKYGHILGAIFWVLAVACVFSYSERLGAAFLLFSLSKVSLFAANETENRLFHHNLNKNKTNEP